MIRKGKIFFIIIVFRHKNLSDVFDVLNFKGKSI